jgi:hypothetical protein
MSQQINLYNPAFEQRRELLSLAGLAAGWSGALLLVVVAASIGSLRVSAFSAELQKEAAARTAAQAEMSRLSAQLAGRKRDASLAAEVDRLEAQFAGRNEIMQTLRDGIIGNTSGFSAYVRAFARQSFEGMWLTAFAVTGAGQDVVLQGRALRPELVPDYVQRLNREAVLKGHAFSELQMRRPDAKTAEADRAALPFVEFRLATLPSIAKQEERQ